MDNRSLKSKDQYSCNKAQHNQKELANFLNQTAVLGGVKFDNGRSALSYVNSVSEFKQDRIIAEVDAGLKDQVAAISGEKSKDGKRYIGPEDSGIEHGIFDVSFRENIKEGAQQLSFASSLKFGRADIDIDYGNPYAGGGLRHAGEVMQNKIFRTKTNPYKVYDQITKRPGAGIKPSYTLSDK